MTDPRPTKQKMSKTKKVGIIIGVVIGVAIAGILVIAFANVAISSAKNQPPPTVTVSGQITTKGFQTHPVGVTFYDQSSGEQQHTTVGGNHYQVDVPNGSHNWRVIVAWRGLAGSSGTCDGGFVHYDNTYTRYITQNINC